MSTLELNVYEIFKTRFSEKEAEKVLEYFEAKAEEKINQKKELFITAKDKETLLTVAVAKDLFASKQDIAETKSDILKWMIGMFIPLYLSIIGLFVTILLKH